LNRQSQSSGDNSTQVQAAGDVFVGISEQRAREIAQETARQVIDVYADEGVRLIQDRILKLDDRVIAALIREGRLEVFGDPGFQRSYRKAQEGAAVSENESDYDLLAALLSDRAARGEARRTRAGIERSIEIVDQIDEDALRGLTVFQALQQYRPLAPSLTTGLDILQKLFDSLLDGPLPTGDDWLDHLDVLDAVRINQLSGLKRFIEFYPSIMPGYLAPGMPGMGSEWPFEINGTSFVHPGLIRPHELRPGHLRFAAPIAETIESTLKVSDEDRNTMLAQARSALGFETVDGELVQPFFEELRKREALAKIENWWGQISQGISVTGVGRILARANAYRLDINGVLPPIE
jgi:hypothetical protein